MKPIKRMTRKHPKNTTRIKKTNPLRCVGGCSKGFAVGLEHSEFEPLTRMAVPSVQEARQCIIRMKTYLGLSVVHLGAVLGIPRNTIAGYHSGRFQPTVCARLLLPRLERELIPQDEYEELFPPPTGSVQPSPDVIVSSKPGDKA